MVAKNDVELAKILMFLDIVTSIARKKFGSTAKVESAIPVDMRLLSMKEDLDLKFDKKYREKTEEARKKAPYTRRHHKLRGYFELDRGKDRQIIWVKRYQRGCKENDKGVHPIH
ncbi:hypothetical protein [Thermococcus barossii]|uniref:Uncharacterized protein n=1 Tax=Thermococcus barossii TaxID=54077 RepID=A0A2Z2MH14_9EURY|nr:hypothetical protein [Thermococcus barossii]ASJ04015.1 hypothetical protein A3L01_01010 [Thermococcus barossii]